MNLSVITVTWNSGNLIREQIKSVAAGCRSISFEEIIVDNASGDGTADLVEKEFSTVQLIRSDKNLGFAGANNLAAKSAQGDFLLFLNPDMRLTEGSLDSMVDWMKKHPDVGLASCKLVDEHGNLNTDAQPRRFPKIWDQLALIFKLPHVFPSILNRYLFKDFNANVEQEVDSVRGSFMMMPRTVYEKLGWAFDPRYFFWFEDVDLCREVKKLGFKVMHTPVINCIDYVGQSIKQRTTLWKQKQFTASMLIYFRKWEPAYVWVWIALFRPVGVALAWTGDRVYKMLRPNNKFK